MLYLHSVFVVCLFVTGHRYVVDGDITLFWTNRYIEAGLSANQGCQVHSFEAMAVLAVATAVTAAALTPDACGLPRCFAEVVIK